MVFNFFTLHKQFDSDKKKTILLTISVVEVNLKDVTLN